jgi:hypothetical protein
MTELCEVAVYGDDHDVATVEPDGSLTSLLGHIRDEARQARRAARVPAFRARSLLADLTSQDPSHLCWQPNALRADGSAAPPHGTTMRVRTRGQRDAAGPRPLEAAAEAAPVFAELPSARQDTAAET